MRVLSEKPSPQTTRGLHQAALSTSTHGDAAAELEAEAAVAVVGDRQLQQRAGVGQAHPVDQHSLFIKAEFP